MNKATSFGILLATLAAPLAIAGPMNSAPVIADTSISIPLRWNTGLNVGYDSNVNPGTFGSKSSTGYLNPYIGASLANYDTQTTYAVNANLGLNYYFKDVDGKSVFSNSQIGFDMTHNFSERTRFTTTNYVAFTQEPNYNYGIASARDLGEYWYLYTNNSIGYRLGDSRWATVTGFSIGYFDYTDYKFEERSDYALYETLRFAASERTVYTGQYSFNYQDRTYGLSTSSHYLTVGTEYRISPTAIIVANAGVQIKKNDSEGGYRVYPTASWTFSQQANDQFTYSIFGRWDNEAISTYDPYSLSSWQSRPTVRLGVDTKYAISPKLSWINGGDFIWSSLDRPTNPALEDGSDATFNLYTGFTYQVTNNLSLIARYTWTTSTGDEIITQNYTRNRVSLGAQLTF